MESRAGLVKTLLPSLPLRATGRALLDLLYPPLCLACDAPVATSGTLCVTCFMRLRAITAPFCPVLGLPFDKPQPAGTLSLPAIADPPPFGRARSAVLYGEVARSLVSRLKYGDRPEIAAFCARFMARAAADLWGENAVLVPIPLHARRLLRRRYNQSTEIARTLSRLTGVPLLTGLLRRRRDTRQQVGLTATGRARNIGGAFTTSPAISRRLAGRRVILVDDVITTGATVKAATRALRSSGVMDIDIVSFARVLTDHVEIV